MQTMPSEPPCGISAAPNMSPSFKIYFFFVAYFPMQVYYKKSSAVQNHQIYALFSQNRFHKFLSM